MKRRNPQPPDPEQSRRRPRRDDDDDEWQRPQSEFEVDRRMSSMNYMNEEPEEGRSGPGAGRSPRQDFPGGTHRGWDPRRRRNEPGWEAQDWARPGREEGYHPGLHGDQYEGPMGNPQPREHFHGKGPHGPSRSDERIRVAVNEALYHDRRVDAREVMVEVRNGEVTLTGTVNDREMKQRTEECVWQVHGVRQVNDMLRVEEDESRRPHRDRERWH